MREYDVFIIKLSKVAIKRLLSQCTEKQQEIFFRIYQDGIEGIKPNQLRMAYTKCIKTIEANKQKAVNGCRY